MAKGNAVKGFLNSAHRTRSGHLPILCLSATFLFVAGGSASAQLHGIGIAKGCEGPVCDGELVVCEIEFSYNDDFGDTLKIHGAWDVKKPNTDPTRIPAVGAEINGDQFSTGKPIGNDDGICDPLEACEGNLPIVMVAGNTTCMVGGGLPCLIGPGGSTLNGLPGDPDPGVITFRSDTYFAQPSDPMTLPDQANVLWEDLCDSMNTQACGQAIMNVAQAPGSVRIRRCTDKDECTTDICSLGECSFEPLCESNVDCDDGDLCTDDVCLSSGCCENTPVNCDDGDLCTTDSCDPAQGCVAEPIVCDDGNACTIESCDPDIGCVQDTVDCNDGEFCNGEEICDPDVGCVAGEPPVCDDGVFCTLDGCDPVTDQCVTTTINEQCDDFDPCTQDLCRPDGCEYFPLCGACCVIETGECLDSVQSAECAAAGGDFQGIGSLCLGDNDGDGLDDLCPFSRVPTVSQWGLAILALLLLTGAKIRFGYHRSWA